MFTMTFFNVLCAFNTMASQGKEFMDAGTDIFSV